MSCSRGVCTPTAKLAVLNVGDLTAMLASGNVEVNTGGGKLARQVKDIVVASGFNWTSANALTLDSYDSITFNKPVVDNGPGAVTLTTDDGDSGGVLYFGANGSLSFAGTANSLTINGAAYMLENSVQALAAAVEANSVGNFALSANYDAGQDGVYSRSAIGILSGALQGLGNTISNLSIGDSDKNPRSYRGGQLALIEYTFYEGRPEGTVSGLVLKDLAIRCNESKGCRAGGIACVSGNMFNDSVSGTFEGENASFGGLAFENFGSIISSDAHVRIHEKGATTASTGYVGGLVAENAGTIEKSSVSGSVSGAQVVGGLVGENDFTIDQSFSTAAVKVTGGHDPYLFVGGLVGIDENYTTAVSNSYATGNTYGGSGAYVAGFVGNDITTAPIEYSYSTGAPTGGAGSTLGGFSGGVGDFSDSYWDMTTSGMDQGTGSGSDAGLTGLTTAQLQAGLPAGFDPTIWAENATINSGMPYLIANPPPK